MVTVQARHIEEAGMVSGKNCWTLHNTVLKYSFAHRNAHTFCVFNNVVTQLQSTIISLYYKNILNRDKNENIIYFIIKAKH